jgi:hypothetical protein
MSNEIVARSTFDHGWSYRQRIRILPGVHLNLSRHGVGVSFGVPGYSISVGPRGTYETNSIPGIGIYRRRKIGGPAVNTPGTPFKASTPQSPQSQNAPAGYTQPAQHEVSWSALVIVLGVIAGVSYSLLTR